MFIRAIKNRKIYKRESKCFLKTLFTVENFVISGCLKKEEFCCVSHNF